MAGALPHRSRVNSGFMLAELIVAAAVASVVAMVLLQLAVAGQRTARRVADDADMDQRLRVAADALYRDLEAAGAGPAVRRAAFAAPPFAPIRPARAGARAPDPDLFAESDRVSILLVPHGARHATLRDDTATAAPLSIDTSSRSCAGESCGLQAGDRILIFDGTGAYEVVTIAAVGPGMVWVPPLGGAYPAGATIVQVVHRVYSLNRATSQLMVYDGGLSEGPLVDHVADLRFTYFAADPADPSGRPLEELPLAALRDGPVLGRPPNRFDADLGRITRIRVTVRVFAAEGPRLPDRTREVSFDISPRNMGQR